MKIPTSQRQRRNNPFTVSNVDRTRTDSFKLQQEYFKLLIKGKKYFLMVSEAQEFPGEVMETSSLEIVKEWINKSLSGTSLA